MGAAKEAAMSLPAKGQKLGTGDLIPSFYPQRLNAASYPQRLNAAQSPSSSSRPLGIFAEASRVLE